MPQSPSHSVLNSHWRFEVSQIAQVDVLGKKLENVLLKMAKLVVSLEVYEVSLVFLEMYKLGLVLED